MSDRKLITIANVDGVLYRNQNKKLQALIKGFNGLNDIIRREESDKIVNISPNNCIRVGGIVDIEAYRKFNLIREELKISRGDAITLFLKHNPNSIRR